MTEFLKDVAPIVDEIWVMSSSGLLIYHQKLSTGLKYDPSLVAAFFAGLNGMCQCLRKDQINEVVTGQYRFMLMHYLSYAIHIVTLSSLAIPRFRIVALVHALKFAFINQYRDKIEIFRTYGIVNIFIAVANVFDLMQDRNWIANPFNPLEEYNEFFKSNPILCPTS